MQFSQLCQYFKKLESTASRNEMTAILADLLKKADSEEIDKICYLSLGRLVPQYESLEFNLAEKMLIRIISQAYNVSEEEVKKILYFSSSRLIQPIFQETIFLFPRQRPR